MVTCTFFGHRDAPWDIKSKLKERIIELITEHGVELFLVGNNGAFDRIVTSVLSELKPYYNFEFQVMLSQMPDGKVQYDLPIYDSINVLPDGIEQVLPRFRIDFRNKYMLEMSDYVIGYIVREYGGAAKFFEMAKRKALHVINIAEKI